MKIYKQFLSRKIKPLKNATAKPPVKNSIEQILLVLAGGLVGVLGNQYFFEKNRRFETLIELQRDFNKQQLPLYNRIINFTYIQTTKGYYQVTYLLKPQNKYDPFGIIYGKNYNISTDTTFYHLPTFITDSIEQIELQKDLKEISENKDKIHPDVWESFIDLNIFLKDHPIPLRKDPEILIKSDWADSAIHIEWKTLNKKLYDAAKGKTNQYLYKLD